jgi:RNA polymerase sigma factor (sigma-70 family)
MTKRWEDNFDPLLAWLDPDRDRAGEKYEDIRDSLVKIFSWRGAFDAEDLADEAITRVINKLPEIAQSYKGDPAKYFYGVAKNLLWELNRREQSRVNLPASDRIEQPAQEAEPDRFEPEFDCLKKCLRRLPKAERELFLQYHQQEQRNIPYRKELARRRGETANSLRVKVYRIRATLQSCIRNCVKNKAQRLK